MAGRGQANSERTKSRTGLSRNAFIITSEFYKKEGNGRSIVLFCNPSSVSWSIPIRGAIQKTHSGEVYHTWKVKNRKTYYDYPTLNFTFQTGNMMPVQVKDTPGNDQSTVIVSEGANNFYDFLEFVDQDRLFEDRGSMRTNYQQITYYSQTFTGMVLRGFFTPEGITFEDSAEDPFNKTWSAPFIVYDTSPKFYSASGLRSLFSQIGFQQDKNQGATSNISF